MSAVCTLTMREIIAATAQTFEVSATDIVSPRREDRIVAARYAAGWLIRELLPRSFPEIGRALGGRDSSTVIKGIAGTEARMQADPAYAAKVETLRGYCLSARSLYQADRNPFEEAERVLRQPRHATGVSVETIRDLAAIAIAALQEATRQEVERADALAAAAAAEAEAPDVASAMPTIAQMRAELSEARAEIERFNRLIDPLRAFVLAEDRLGICSAAGQRAARENAERARITLATAAQAYFNSERTEQ